MLYTVWDLVTETERVLKVLIEPSLKALELFEQEAAVLASLQHPGVPRVEPHGYFLVSLGNKERQPCLVMEKINGQTLQEILDQNPQGCPEAWVVSWLKQAVDTLQELHSRKIIHRDLKPSNLMLRHTTGQLVVIDFGGAKIGSASSRQASSTRLFSSGYSPPEQIAGRSVGPATDFYALGRTMIQLLTGIYPPKLEDPMTGELRWRTGVSISPDFADLLDQLVREDVTQRPTTATAIQERLAQISQSSVGQVSIFKLIGQWIQSCLNWSWVVISAFTKGISQATLFLLRAIVQLVRACRDTIWAMVLSAIATCVSTVAGFVLAYWSPLGPKVNAFFQQSPLLVPDPQIVGAEIFIFSAAGLGTAWGLTAAGGFGQRRRYLVAVLMGLLGYGLGWLVWRAAMPYGGVEPVIGLTVVAVALLTLGLGVPSHYLVHAVVTSAGTTTLVASMVSLKLFQTPLFHLELQPSWLELWVYVAFFCFVSIAISFWLGVSYYLVVPFLRFLGWR